MGRRVAALRRVGSGLSMMVAPLLWFVSSALGPGHEASRNLADMLPPIAADPNLKGPETRGIGLDQLQPAQ